MHSTDVTPSGGTYSLTVQPGYVYTLTTTTGQGKGTATSPGQGALALPYSDTFDGYATGTEAKYLMDIQGSFEVVGCGGGRSGQCVRQMSEQAPIYWTTQLAEPYALLGDLGWSNYTVSSDVMLEKAGYVAADRPRGRLPARVPGQPERLLPAGHRHRLRGRSSATTPATPCRPWPAVPRRRSAPVAGTPWR